METYHPAPGIGCRRHLRPKAQEPAWHKIRRRRSPRHEVKARIDAGVFERLLVGVCFEVLALRADAELRRVERRAQHAVIQHAQPAEIVLIERDCAVPEGKVAGFQAGLRECNVATDALGLPLRQIIGDHINDRLRHIGVDLLDVRLHLPGSCLR